MSRTEQPIPISRPAARRLNGGHTVMAGVGLRSIAARATPSPSCSARRPKRSNEPGVWKRLHAMRPVGRAGPLRLALPSSRGLEMSPGPDTGYPMVSSVWLPTNVQVSIRRGISNPG